MRVVNSDNIKILNEVGRWKAISLSCLSHSLGWNRDYSVLRKRLKKLEATGHLKGLFERRKVKYFILTEKGAELSIYPCFYKNFGESVIHDLTCTNAILELLQFKLFQSGSAIDYIDSNIKPDGVIHASRYGIDYVLAIELELHQKSKNRMLGKFIKYVEEEAFNHVLYITNKQSIFDAYRKILMEMNNKVRDKIILELGPTLSVSIHDYENAIYWINGVYKTFWEMFGGRQMIFALKVPLNASSASPVLDLPHDYRYLRTAPIDHPPSTSFEGMVNWNLSNTLSAANPAWRGRRENRVRR